MTDPSADNPTAVVGRRVVAHLIDVVVYFAAVAVPFYLLGERSTVDLADGEPLADAFRLPPDYAIRIDNRQFLFERNDLLVVAAVSIGVVLLFGVIIQGRFGWTVGKLLTGIRTVNRRGVRPGIGRAFVRTLLWVVDAIPSFVLPLVAGISALLSRDHRRIGDFAGGTYVVARRFVGEDPTGGDLIDTSGWQSLADQDEGSPTVTTLAEGQSLRVGESAEPAGTSEPAGPAEAAPTYQPQWDPARQAYLQWDPRRRQWLQFDDGAGEWRPVG